MEKVAKRRTSEYCKCCEHESNESGIVAPKQETEKRERLTMNLMQHAREVRVFE